MRGLYMRHVQALCHACGGSAYTEDAIRTLAEIMVDTSAPQSARVAASKELIDRAYGKAPQPHDGDGEGGPVKAQITVTFIKPENKD